MVAGRIVVIGDQDAVMGLALIGLEGWVVTTPHQAAAALERALHDPQIALVLLTDEWAEPLQAVVAEAMLSASGPTVVEIPSPRSPAAATLHERIERRLGVALGA